MLNLNVFFFKKCDPVRQLLTAQSCTYASAVVGRTLTNSVLVSRAFSDESAGSSGTQRDAR